MATADTKLITAEEFMRMPDMGPCELVRGEIVKLNVPYHRHGRICRRIARALDRYLEQNEIGDFNTNDSGVITERGPDTVRGPDLYYHSYSRLPADTDPEGYAPVPPEIVWEVVSPSDRWPRLLGKVQEYLEAGVLVVCVIDPKNQCVITYYPDRPQEKLEGDAIWRESTILPGFELPLEELFRRGRK